MSELMLVFVSLVKVTSCIFGWIYAGSGVLDACPKHARSELGWFAGVVKWTGNAGSTTKHGNCSIARRRACWLHVPATRKSDRQSRPATIRRQSVVRQRTHSSRTGNVAYRQLMHSFKVVHIYSCSHYCLVPMYTMVLFSTSQVVVWIIRGRIWLK